MTEPSGGVAADLVATLEHGATHVDDGQFTIDAGEARRKLADYQVGDPHEWVLILIEAAALAGQAPIRIQTKPSITVELGPIEIDRAQLPELFALAFVDLRGLDERERVRRRTVQKLAVACSTALRLDPAALEIEVVEDREVARLALASAGDQPNLVVAPRPPELELGVRVRMRPKPFSVGQPEADLIRERCRYSALEILLDGDRVSLGHLRALQTDVDLEQVMFRSNARKVRPLILDERPIGVAGLRLASHEPAEIVILVNGVFAERRSIADGQPEARGFMAIVELDLAKDLSQTQVSHGPELARVIERIRGVHDEIAGDRERAAPTLAQRSIEPPARTDRSELARRRRQRVFEIVRATILATTGLATLALVVLQVDRFLAWMLLLSVVSALLLAGAVAWRNTTDA